MKFSQTLRADDIVAEADLLLRLWRVGQDAFAQIALARSIPVSKEARRGRSLQDGLAHGRLSTQHRLHPQHSKEAVLRGEEAEEPVISPVGRCEEETDAVVGQGMKSQTTQCTVARGPWFSSLRLREVRAAGRR